MSFKDKKIKLKNIPYYFKDINKNKNKNINYKKYMFLITYLLGDLETLKEHNKKIVNFDKVSSYFITLYDNDFINSIKYTFNQKLLYNSFYSIEVLDKLKPKLLNKKNLEISFSTNSIFRNNSFGIQTDYIVLFEKYKKKEEITKTIQSYTHLNLSIKLIELEEFLYLEDNNVYDNVVVKPNLFKITYQIEIFSLIHLSKIIILIYKGLKNLKVGGNLFIIIPILKPNKAYEKIFYLLGDLFEDIKIEFEQTILCLTATLICSGLKKNISKKNDEELFNICNDSIKYTYHVLDVMNYLYYVNKYEDNSFLLNIDKNELKTFKVTQNKLMVIDDIDLTIKENILGKILYFQLLNDFNNYFNNVSLFCLKYVEENKDGTIKIDKEVVDKIVYERLIQIIYILNKNKIPYNKVYLVHINNYNKYFMNKLFTFEQKINYNLIKYNKVKKSFKSKKSRKSKKSSKSKKSWRIEKELYKLGKYASYHYEELNNIQDENSFGYKIKEDLLKKLDLKKIPKEVKEISEGFARGVAKYALINFKLPHKTSNGYMKLWEIYATVPQLVQRKKQLNVFHLAEAPGQWINCTRHFIETKRQQVQHYNWLANSLNPTNPDNIAKYGKYIFGDDYGFLKRYPQKWLFGADDTGDITKSANVRWFRDYMERFVKKGGQPIHLVTGDAGMVGDIPLVELQKIEYAQMCMVAATSSIGGNCVIKHFLHYLNAYPNSYEGSGFMISFIYIYYLMFDEVRLIKPHTSNPNSREFYLVGLRFRGINDDIFNKLMKNLDNFEENHCFFKREEIPESFTKQVINFMNDLFTLNSNNYQLQNMLMTCINNKDPIIEKEIGCKKYLDGDFIKKIQTKRYKEWIKTYGFR